jgi:hypothetical protein
METLTNAQLIDIKSGLLKWNNKFYGAKYIFINNSKYFVTTAQRNQLLAELLITNEKINGFANLNPQQKAISYLKAKKNIIELLVNETEYKRGYELTSKDISWLENNCEITSYKAENEKVLLEAFSIYHKSLFLAGCYVCFKKIDGDLIKGDSPSIQTEDDFNIFLKKINKLNNII